MTRASSPTSNTPRLSPRAWAVLALGLVALALSPLLIGIEPVGGDPDRIFRPIALERARAYKTGHIPWWSDAFGFGVPLVAESHAAAFYPLNPILDLTCSVHTAYRLSMWLHLMLLAGGTLLYARNLGLTPQAAALAAVITPLTGWMSIHSSHIWSYQAMAWLPWILLAVDRLIHTGRPLWIAAISTTWGLQLLTGHFQLQFHTGLLALAAGIWSCRATRQPPIRLLLLAMGLAGGLALAAIQLGPTWELAGITGRARLPLQDLLFYSFPPAHLAELVAPRLFRELPGGPEAPYWFSQQTTGYEVSLWIGSIPFALACFPLGFQHRIRMIRFWAVIALIGLALATMPRWAAPLYAAITFLPGFGLFRCPARYTALASFALALLAASGLDALPSLSKARFRLALALVALLALIGLAWGFAWFLMQPRGRIPFRLENLPWLNQLGFFTIAWSPALLALVAVRLWPRAGSAACILLTTVELTLGYYTSTTIWGRAVHLPDASPILKLISKSQYKQRVAGPLDNLPVWAGQIPATPYFGFTMPGPYREIEAAMRLLERGTAFHNHPFIPFQNNPSWTTLERFGVRWVVIDHHDHIDVVSRFLRRDTFTDPALDLLAKREPFTPRTRPWLAYPLLPLTPHLRFAQTARPFPDDPSFLEYLLRQRTDRATPISELLFRESDGLPELIFAGDPSSRTPAQRASLLAANTSARILSESANATVIEHDGPIYLVWNRAYYPGWSATVEQGGKTAPATLYRVEGGLQCLPLSGSGTSTITLRYTPTNLAAWAWLSLAALGMILAITWLDRPRKRPVPNLASHPSADPSAAPSAGTPA